MTPSRLRGQRGFSIVTAVFLLVALAGLAAAIINLGGASRTAAVLDLQGARAYQAARAGIEWGLFQQLRLNTCAASTNIAMPAGALSGFTATVACTRTPLAVVVGGTTVATAQLVSNVATGSANVSMLSTAALVAGMPVQGPAGNPNLIAAGTVIAAVSDPTTVILSRPALSNGTSVNLTFYSPLDRWNLDVFACNQPNGAGACPNPTNNADYVQRRMQVQF
ncbi:MAG TPA: hypothetical protein VIT92_02970 [Burkholderiaceae bacterium]